MSCEHQRFLSARSGLLAIYGKKGQRRGYIERARCLALILYPHPSGDGNGSERTGWKRDIRRPKHMDDNGLLVVKHNATDLQPRTLGSGFFIVLFLYEASISNSRRGLLYLPSIHSLSV